MSVEQQIRELRSLLNEYNHKYYVENNPVVSDFEFDALLRQLQDLERDNPEFDDPNSPTKRVGSDLSNSFSSVEHSFPMLSLSNTYSLDELHEWIERTGYSAGQIINTLRLSVVGACKGPGMFDVLALVGKEQVLARIDAAIAKLGMGGE